MEAIKTQLIVLLFIELGLLITPIIFIALDFWAGIRKSRQRGEPIRSDKMKRTLDKLSRYYNAILAMLVLDAIQVTGLVFLHLYNGWSPLFFPFFTMLSVLFVAAVEVKSIVEPATAKERRERKDVTELAKAIVEHRQDPKEIAEVIIEYLEKKSDK